MATIQTAIELQDNFTNVLNSLIGSVNTSIASLGGLQRAMGANIDTSSIDNARESIESVTEAVRQMETNATQNIVISQTETPHIDTPQIDIPKVEVSSVEIPQPNFEWQSDTFTVFDTSGVERFNSEISSAVASMETLTNAQSQITQNSQNVNLFPEKMGADMESLQNRLQRIGDKITAIGSNPINIGSDEANAGLEQLRAQLDSAIHQQEAMNNAVNDLNVDDANSSYLRLSDTVQNIERYIRDNVNEQGAFNSAIQRGAGAASTLSSLLQKAVGFFGITLGARSLFGFLSDSMGLFNEQLNSEIQLSTVLANQLGENFENAYDQIVKKAGEIQSKGMFGDEAMIAGAAEISTYIKDPEAISSMMDTLANYAAGMSGGRAVDNRAMTEYATGLSKVISGSYASMTKKGFAFTDAQKAVIDGTATQTQLVEALGDKYAEMSADMQKATVIGNVINEVWGGMYATMSNTPQNRIQQFQNAFGDLKEEVGRRVIPVVANFADIFMKNLDGIKKVFYGVANGVNILGTVLGKITSLALKAVSAIIDNWSLIAPVVYTATTALTAYYLSLKWTAITTALASAQTAILKAVHLACAAAQLVYAAATGTLTSATIAATAAQHGLNVAMLACPATWIVVAIIAIIGVLYLACAVISKVTETTVSATGVICGMFAFAGALIGNIVIGTINNAISYFVTFWNFIASFANFFANVFNDPAGAIQKLFFDLIESILGMFVSMAESIDKIFGTSLSEKVGGWRKDLQAEISTKFQNQTEVVSKIDPEDYMIKKRFDMENAFMDGYDFGESLPNLDFLDGFKTEAFSRDEYNELLKHISENTDGIVDSANVSKERLAYLRDIAEQEAINRYTTASINIDMSGMQNTMNNATDIDGVISSLSNAMTESVEVMAEGVY